MDKIIQGNIANIIFLKSTDDSLLETLEKLSGTRHKVYNDSETLTVDESKLVMKNSAIISKNRSSKEEPVISRDDMLRITKRNSIVFSAGEHPIWNRNQHNLPMAWRLHKGEKTFKGREFTLKNVPTTSIVSEFDVDQNQPDFDAMLNYLMEQAVHSETAQKMYRTAFKLTDNDVERMDMNVYAEGVMSIIDGIMNKDYLNGNEQALVKVGSMDENIQAAGGASIASSASAKHQTEDKELLEQARQLRDNAAAMDKPIGNLELTLNVLKNLGQFDQQVQSDANVLMSGHAMAEAYRDICVRVWDTYADAAEKKHDGWFFETDEDSGDIHLKKERTTWVTRKAKSASNGAGDLEDGSRIYNNTEEMREELGRFIMGSALADQLYARDNGQILPRTENQLRQSLNGQMWKILSKVFERVE